MNSKRKTGIFWHIHHDTLFEWSRNIIERINYIKKFKPKGEVRLRLKLLKPIRGRLPIGVREAKRVLDEAQRAYNKADIDFSNSNIVKRNALNKLHKTYKKARIEFDTALDTNYLEIVKLHKRECKDCPWDGVSIFSSRSS